MMMIKDNKKKKNDKDYCRYYEREIYLTCFMLLLFFIIF